MALVFKDFRNLNNSRHDVYTCNSCGFKSCFEDDFQIEDNNILCNECFDKGLEDDL